MHLSVLILLAVLLLKSVAAAAGAPFALVSPERAAAVARSHSPSRGAVLRNADRALDRPSHAMERIGIEGTLPHHGIHDESAEAIKDFSAARDLALAGRATGDPRYTRKAAAIISQWLQTYRQPSFNPIDETQLERMIVAYDLLPPEAKAPLAKPMNRLLRLLATGYLDPSVPRLGATATNNWQSHRIKLGTLAAYAMGDDALVAKARSAFRRQLQDNLRPDGSTIDFEQRDAVHYAVFDLEPLALAALAAREHGEDWYHLKNPQGVGLEEALLWLRKYADGTARHEEFARSRVKFDAERRKAGVSGFGGKFDPKGAREVMMIAARLDRRFVPTTKALGWSTPLFDMVWPLEE